MKFLKIITLITALLIGKSISTLACVCVSGNGSFLTQLDSILLRANFGLSNANFVVVKGIVEGYTLNSLGVIFKPLHYYFHTSAKNPFIIWGTSGTDCRLSISAIAPPNADTVILIMHRITVRTPMEDTTDFEVSRCGNNYITVRNDSVFGGWDSSLTLHGYPLNQFEDTLNHLLYALKIESPAQPGFGAVLFPNPVGKNETIQLRGLFDEDIQISICDVSGRSICTISRAKSGLTEQQISIPVKGLSNGFYTIQLISQRRKQRLHFTMLE